MVFDHDDLLASSSTYEEYLEKMELHRPALPEYEKNEGFWNRQLVKKYSTFGSEPRQKGLRGGPRSKVDSGMLQYEYTQGWTQKDLEVNAFNPRPQLSSTYGVLASTPGPGEYGDQCKSFEKSSRFYKGGIFTVKGKDRKKEANLPAKTPRNLLSFRSKDDDPLLNIKKAAARKKRQEAAMIEDDADETMVLTRKEQQLRSLTDKQLREEIRRFSQVPGPSAYANSEKPFNEDKLSVGFDRGPTAAQLKPRSRATRNLVNHSDQTVRHPREFSKFVPGPGAYNLDEPTGKYSPKISIAPDTPLRHLPKSVRQPIGDYNVIEAYEKSSRMSSIAKRLQKTDMLAKN